jgi:L-ribulose-5-phosphate 3-epimerase UlaE
VHARCAALGHLQVPFHENTIDYERVIERLDDHGYEGSIAIEYWVEPEMRLDVLWETVALRDLLREIILRVRGG